MKDNKYDKLKNEYKDKMLKAINNHDIEVGHYDCDDVLVSLLLELGFDEIVEIYKTQDKWYA
jgi:hypothetical protein